jgi:hypothetical protein
MKTQTKVLVNFRADIRMYDAVSKIADAEGISPSNIYRDAVLDWLKKYDGKDEHVKKIVDMIKLDMHYSEKVNDAKVALRKLTLVGRQREFIMTQLEKGKSWKKLKSWLEKCEQVAEVQGEGKEFRKMVRELKKLDIEEVVGHGSGENNR